MDPSIDSDDGAHLAIERQLGIARLAAALIGTLQLLVPGIEGPAWTGWLAWTGIAVLLGAGVTALAAGRRPERVGRRAADLAARAETLAFASLLPTAPDEHTAFVVLVLVLMSVFAGLREGRRGVIRALAVGAVAEAVRVVVALTVAHLHVEETVTALTLAAAVGLVVGHGADLSRRRAEQARTAAVTARTEAARSRARAEFLDLQHRVLLAGVGGHVDQALQRMVDELEQVLAPATVTVVLDDGGGTFTVAATSDPGRLTRDRAVLQPGSAVTRAVHTGRATSHRGADGRIVTWAGPIGHDDRRVGVLCIDARPGDALDPELLGIAGRLAAQMTLVIDAASALERESDLAQRYRELDRMKTDFIAITSHELRTPLTAIAGSIATLGERWDDLTPPLRETLFGVVRRQSDRLERLTDDLRTVSRMDSGSLRIQVVPTSLRGVVGAVTAGTPADAEIRAHGPDVQVLADPDRLEQILANLVNNGLAHGRPPIDIDWRVRTHHVDLAVTDHGDGIPPQEHERVFDRFVHIAPTESHGQGSGLGLAIARELAEAMDGDLTLDPSSDRRGARFRLRLPRARPGDDPSAPRTMATDRPV